MRKIALVLAVVLASSGCAPLVIHPWDSDGVTAAKVATRIPLGILTLGVSELGIEEAKQEERCGGPCPINPAAAALMLGILQSRPIYTAPTYYPPPIAYPSVPLPAPPVNCTSSYIGHTVQTYCR